MSVQTYADLARTVLGTQPRLGGVRAVAVDGPAGSGKTTFARRLGTALRVEGASVTEIHTDDLLDGWVDMISFWPRLAAWVLRPLERGEPGAYRRYDWVLGRFDPQWHEVPVPDVLLVEGVTSARAQARPYLSLSVFVTAEREVCLARGLARDGEALRPQWLTWMDGEARHFAADATESQVDIRIDGSPSPAHDPERAFVRLPAATIGAT